MRTFFRTLATLASILFMGASGYAQSANNLIGEKLSVDWRYPDANTSNPSSQGYPAAFTVPADGTNVTFGANPNLSISVSGDVITILFPGPGNATYGFSGPPGSPDGASDVGSGGEPVTFNGAVIADLSNSFAGVTIAATTSLPGLDSSRVFVSSNALYVNFMGLYNTPGLSQVVLNVQVSKSPSITTQPQSEDVAAGSSVTFGVASTGAAPLAFQWQINGTNLSDGGNILGSTSNLLTISNASMNAVGNYDVIVGNNYGAVTSSIASLTLIQTCVPPPAGLAAWWQGEGNADDSAGTNNGTFDGGVAFVPGSVGQAFDFAGDSGVVVPSSPSLEFGTNDFSVEFWVQFQNLNDGNGIVSKDSYSGSSDYQGWLFNICSTCGSGFGQIGQAGLGIEVRQITNGVGPDVQARWDTTNLVAGAWYHVAGICQSSVLYLYVNGQLEATTPEPVPINVSSGAILTMGMLNPIEIEMLSGELDEVSIYNRALAPNEVAALFAAGSAGKCVGSLANGPTITQQPTNLVVSAGLPAVVTVTASGTPPLNYQWQFDGTNLTDNGRISGTTSNVLTIINALGGDAGNYDVIINNSYGSMTSSVANIFVISAPETNDLVFTGSPNGSWAWSELIVANPNDTAYFPTSTNEYANASFQGFVTFGDNSPYGPAIESQIVALGYQVLSTWVLSSSNQTLNIVFNGDDGHTLFVDGQSLGGAGFGVPVSTNVSFTAGVPRKLDLAIYNSIEGWAGYLGLGPWEGYVEGNWSNLLENTPGLTLSADGFASGTSQPTNLLVNGSFESPQVNSNAFAYAVPTGWTWTAGAAITPEIANGVETSGGVTYQPAEDGQQWLSIGSAGDGSLSQIVTIPLSGSYLLSWFAIVGPEGQSSSPSPYAVSFAGITNQFDAGASLGQTWELQNLLISNLTAGQYTLKFTPETVQSGFATIIDNVTLRGYPIVTKPPFANNQGVAGLQNTAFPITLTGSDPNSPPLPVAFTITATPSHGYLSGSAPSLIYTPTNDYIGSDSFAFSVNNGLNSSTSATVSITVVEPGQTLSASSPVAAGQTATASIPPTASEAGVTITLTHSSGTQPATVSVQNYPSNPTSDPIGGVGTTFVDVKALNLGANDTGSIGLSPDATITCALVGCPGNAVVVYHAPRHGPGPQLPPGVSPWNRVYAHGHGPVVMPLPSTPGASSGSGTKIPINPCDAPTPPDYTGIDGCILSGTVFAIATVAPPVPAANFWATVENQPASIPVTNLLAGAISLTAGPLDITNVNFASTAGGTISLSSGAVIYSPPSGFVGEDSFNYTLSDDFASAPGTVTVTVMPSTKQSYNKLSISVGGPCIVIQFLGNPNGSYVVQSSDSLMGPWADLPPVLTADSNGLVVYSDCDLTIARFYRIRTNP